MKTSPKWLKKLAATHVLRPEWMHSPFVVDGWLCATNGYRLTAVRVGNDFPNRKVIPANTKKSIRQWLSAPLTKRTAEVAKIREFGNGALVGHPNYGWVGKVLYDRALVHEAIGKLDEETVKFAHAKTIKNGCVFGTKTFRVAVMGVAPYLHSWYAKAPRLEVKAQ